MWEVNIKPYLFEETALSPESRLIFAFLYVTAYYFISMISYYTIRKVRFAVKYGTELLGFWTELFLFW